MPDALQISNDVSEIYVGNFPFNYSADDVRKFFAGYNVQGVRRCRNIDHVYAFVKFSDIEQAMEAIDEYKNISLDGKKLTMRIAHPNRQRDQSQSRPASRGQIHHGSPPSNHTINGYESDVSDDSDDSDEPPPLVPIPKHILIRMIRDLNATTLPEKTQVRPALLPTPVIKEIKDGKAINSGFVETSARREPIAEVVICEFPQGTTEGDTMISNGINGYDSDVFDDPDGPPPLVPIPQHILWVMIQDRNAALLEENKSVEPIQIIESDTENSEVEDESAISPIPKIKEITDHGNCSGSTEPIRVTRNDNENDDENNVEVQKEPSSISPISKMKENEKEIPDGKMISCPTSSESSVIRQERVAKVIICDFPPGTTEVELLELFEIYCPVKCKVMVNSPDDSMEGFTYAFMFLLNGRAATLAASNLNGTVFKGKKISVKYVVLSDALL